MGRTYTNVRIVGTPGREKKKAQFRDRTLAVGVMLYCLKRTKANKANCFLESLNLLVI